MDCREARSLADAFISEQLLVETTRAVVTHLDGCAACRAEFDTIRRVREATRSAFERSADLAPRPAFSRALAERLRAGTAPRLVSRRWMSIAAALVLVTGAGWGWRDWASSSLVELMHAAIGDHRNCALVFKLQEPPISLEEAERRYGGINRLLQTVEPSAATLDGESLTIVERHSCVFEGRRFAHLVLRYRQEAVSLLVSDDPRPLGRLADAVGRETAVSPGASIDGFQVASFRGTRRVVFVVSSLPSTDVAAVAEAMAGPLSRMLDGA